MGQDAVHNYYSGYDEQARLGKTPAHRLEFLTNMAALERYLPPQGRVLDVCAGTGAYAFALAERGYRVTACDLMPHYVQAMRESPAAHLLTDIQVCDALHMEAFAGEGFDAVLCMGALYHLRSPAEQAQTAAQCAAAVKKGGLVAFAYLNRLALALMEADESLRNISEVEAVYNGAGEVFVGSAPEEIEALAAQNSITPLCNVASDGMVYWLGERLNRAAPEDYARWVEFHLRTCESRGLLGASLHCLYVGRAT